jgi:hypothetical protein
VHYLVAFMVTKHIDNFEPFHTDMQFHTDVETFKLYANAKARISK